MRVGIVGARFAARLHFENYRRIYGVPVRVAGVFSVSRDSREAFARERGIAACATFDELCDACDVIDICAPPAAHAALAVEALARGKHVIIEKPFTGFFGSPGDSSDFRGDGFSKEVMLREAVASCDRILEAARTSGKRIGYAENWVYAPAIAKEREILRKTDGQISPRIFPPSRAVPKWKLRCSCGCSIAARGAVRSRDRAVPGSSICCDSVHQPRSTESLPCFIWMSARSSAHCVPRPRSSRS